MVRVLVIKNPGRVIKNPLKVLKLKKTKNELHHVFIENQYDCYYKKSLEKITKHKVVNFLSANILRNSH